MDGRDWLIGFLVTCAWIAATVFLFLHPDPVIFGMWGTLSTTVIGFYHWLVVFDSKRPDAGQGNTS